MKTIYFLNIIVAGWIGVTSIFYPKTASVSIFSNAYANTEVIKVAGCLWFAIAVLSLFGLWRPQAFATVLLLQLIYKGSWLLFVALPAIQNNRPYPKGMAAFFLVWVIILPFIIPWSDWIKLKR